jgi:hypothetical protein
VEEEPRCLLYVTFWSQAQAEFDIEHRQQRSFEGPAKMNPAHLKLNPLNNFQRMPRTGLNISLSRQATNEHTNGETDTA